MVDVVQFYNRTVIKVIKGEVNTDLLAFKFDYSTRQYTFTIRHWCGFGHISHKHFLWQFLTDRGHAPICEETQISVKDCTVTFCCRDWKRVKTLRSHHKAVDYANKLLERDIMGEDYVSGPPADPGISHYDSHDYSWHDISQDVYLRSRQLATLESLQNPRFVSFEYAKQVGNDEWVLRIRAEDASYAVLWDCNSKDGIVFKLKDLRVIGNLPLAPRQWIALTDAIHALMCSLERMHSEHYKAHYDVIEHQYIIDSCAVGLRYNRP